MSTNGRHSKRRGSRAGRRIVVFAVAGVLAFAVGIIAASLWGGDQPAVQGSATAAPTTTPTSASSTGTPIQSTSPSGEPTPSQAPTSPVSDLADGRYFVRPSATAGGDGEPLQLSFDQAQFLTGADAVAAAAANGEEAASGYYVVNDSTELSELPFASDVAVEYFPIGSCCDPVPGDLDAWIQGLHGAENGYAGSTSWWWIVIRNGQIVRIEEQYLP